MPRIAVLACCCFLLAPLAELVAQSPKPAPEAREAARLNNLGTALMNQQRLDRGAEEFAKAAKADPKLSLASSNEGIALLYLQKLPEAQKALETAAALDPNDPHTWYALGLLYRSQNNAQQSLGAFNHVLALDPTDPDAHYMAASEDLDLNDLPAAEAELRKALAASPVHASALFGLARVQRRRGDVSGSQITFAQFQRVSSEKLSSPLAHTYGDEGRYARVEDLVLTPGSVDPMIPVLFTETWRSPPLTGKGSAANTCTIDLAPEAEQSLVQLGNGEEAIHLWQRGLKEGKATFTELPASATGLHAPGRALACAVGDYDNDGRPDLAVALTDRASGKDVLLLFHNLGHNRFEEVAAHSGLQAANHASSLTFVDYDHDGDLDLFITGSPTAASSTPNTLWRNNGDRTFTNWTKEAGLGGAAPTKEAVLSDLNNDRAIDLLTAGQDAAPVFFANRREGAFHTASLYPETLPATTRVTTLDFDKDDWMDVLLTHGAAPGVTLWRNHEGHSFERVALPLPGVLSASAAIPIDFDNDGWIDLALLVNTAHGPELRVLRNLGPGGFADVSTQLHLNALHLRSPQSLLAADFNRSGAPDLLVTQGDGSLVLLSNQGGNRHHSLRLSVAGLADNKSGIGTKVEVFANGLRQKWEVTNATEILAGMGTATNADFVRLLWPTGVPQDEIDIAANKPLTVTELDRRGSSCPTLFAWNGSRYNFVADVIGAAVIGHWVAPARHNIPDPDEWIKIEGSQLKAQHGLLSLRFGEPMEEVNFVDQVRLIAVDHPAGTAVYPNEGFLSEPPFAQDKTIAAAAAHPLAGAWDDHHHNVLALLSRPDAAIAHARRYVQDFTNLPFTGFANSHALTLDLGAWSPERPLRLLLHGFIEYFSASSMYAAWQAGLSPVPPYIEAQLPDGTWRKVVNDMGFPAGLPRTVTVDLTGKLPAGTQRLRIVTNLQIYWDQALVDNESVPAATAQTAVRRTELPLSQASLAFRGYPHQIDGRTAGDLTYDYQQISASGPFVPHRGAYTRYGEVTPLLRSVDDEFVIFGTGEDMDLEFQASALPPLPSGWARDYFFYANGFVKDMDFYEADPFEVGRLPFHGMSEYPYPRTEHYPDDAAHTAYQLEYNTRFEAGDSERLFQFHYEPKHSVPESKETALR